MVDLELEDFAREHALPDDALDRLRDLLARARSRQPPAEDLYSVGGRYEDLGILGVGAMGEVRRVRDRVLNRTMAMKTIKAPLVDHPAVLARFVEEAQATAQLQHPGIVPVHELGRLSDGRPYFTMTEVRGRTLGAVNEEVHAASNERWAPSVTGWTFRRLIDAFHRVCEAVAYAHERGVVHRDLKPDNIMLGGHGEVLVVDWGLAKVTGRRSPDDAAGASELVVTDRSQDVSQATLSGQVAGTPAYMSPEQARGAVDAIDARSDVYSLGAVLYEILSGQPPYLGSSAYAVLAQVLSRPPDPLGSASSANETFDLWLSEVSEAPEVVRALPQELVAVCERAMAREPDDRFDDAASLALEVAAWLDGARRREQALAVVERARSRVPEAAAHRARAEGLRMEAARLLEGVQGWQPEEDKATAWAFQDEADALERQARLAELDQEHLLAGALTHMPDLEEAHASLAAGYRAEHEAAEAERADPIRSEVLLRTHVAALPEDHPDRAPQVAYLRGDGALTLVTEPPGAEVLLHRYERVNRRLNPVLVRSLGRTPLRQVSVPMGSYLCVVRHPERAEVLYPVVIGRQEHWDGVPPEGRSPRAVHLPRADDLGPDDCHLPGGWFWAGGGADASNSLPRTRLWCEDLVVRRFPVTNTQYLEFLNDLVGQGRRDEALGLVPRAPSGTRGQPGAMVYGFENSRFFLQPDSEGDVWLPDYPVCLVDWFGATAYAKWLARGSGRPWRLLAELEWEKAARGVDGRFHPWGDELDPSWCCMTLSHAGRALPSVVDSFPVDCSPYGVRGLGGNIRDWCSNSWVEATQVREAAEVGLGGGPGVTADVGVRAIRGGSWEASAIYCPSVVRSRTFPDARTYNLGFRVARSLEGGNASRQD